MVNLLEAGNLGLDNELYTYLLFAVITCFCYIQIILLDHKKVRFSHLFQMCSKSFQINF